MKNTNVLIKPNYIITPNYILIKDSYKIKSSRDMYYVLKSIINDPLYKKYGYTRNVSNYIAE